MYMLNNFIRIIRNINRNLLSSIFNYFLK